ncbi:unnamed protein product [Rangifer tarandus platyrhynchus]|uniref:Uncharacterized protein n=2 Tax=Rangifer tarandus platyrhynchus TaxID=3082113 RepID=A0ABN8ZK16_RANTA|nr:unnamed protein product [Rangifer tarandus platyrhynchus]CAI9708940.1 unnamed protein product [Rangifer tarandus platyrhynchus]
MQAGPPPDTHKQTRCPQVPSACLSCAPSDRAEVLSPWPSPGLSMLPAAFAQSLGRVSSTGRLPSVWDRKAAPRETGKARDKLSIPQGGGV